MFYNIAANLFTMYDKRTYDAPAILSFLLPGLGQFIKNQQRKAYCLWLSLALLIFLKMYTPANIFLLAVVYFGGWLWNIKDAYNSDTDFAP